MSLKKWNWITMTFAAVAIATTPLLAARRLIVTSKSVYPGHMISLTYVANSLGCTGNNVSPDLKWKGAPSGTKFFAVTVYDPDAPTGSGWWHWVVFNIPAGTTGLSSGAGSSGGSLPEGAIQVHNDGGEPGYMGPCPPPGSKPHHYLFRVYALKDRIPLDRNASPAKVGFYINSLKIAEGKIVALYARK